MFLKICLNIVSVNSSDEYSSPWQGAGILQLSAALDDHTLLLPGPASQSGMRCNSWPVPKHPAWRALCPEERMAKRPGGSGMPGAGFALGSFPSLHFQGNFAPLMLWLVLRAQILAETNWERDGQTMMLSETNVNIKIWKRHRIALPV